MLVERKLALFHHQHQQRDGFPADRAPGREYFACTPVPRQDCKSTAKRLRLHHKTQSLSNGRRFGLPPARGVVSARALHTIRYASYPL